MRIGSRDVTIDLGVDDGFDLGERGLTLRTMSDGDILQHDPLRHVDAAGLQVFRARATGSSRRLVKLALRDLC